MAEGIQRIENNNGWTELLSKHDKPISTTEFESIVSILPGYPFPPEYLQETLRNFDIVIGYNPRSLNPPVYWHVADLPDGENDLLRFAVAVSESYQLSDQGKYLTKMPLISRLNIGVERWRDNDQSLHVYFSYFADTGKFECVDISDKSYANGHRGWIKISPKGVIEHSGTMEQIGRKVSTLKSVSIENFMKEFFKTDLPFNISDALGIKRAPH